MHSTDTATSASSARKMSAPQKEYKCQFCNRAFQQWDRKGLLEPDRRPLLPQSLAAWGLNGHLWDLNGHLWDLSEVPWNLNGCLLGIE
jgi:hypothetical protein